MDDIIQVKFYGKKEIPAIPAEAIVEIIDPSRLHFQFVKNFFEDGHLYILSPEEAEKDSKRQGYRQNDTTVMLTDENRFHSTIRFDKGRIEEAYTKTDKLVSINPQKGFSFWVCLSNGLRESPQIPDETKENLERVSHITSLKDYFEKLRERHGSLDKFFSSEYLKTYYPKQFKQYHQSSLD